MVEHRLAKARVAGSSPVSRSSQPGSDTHSSAHHQAGFMYASRSRIFLPKARYPSGKGEVCKTFMRRFDPDPRLQKINNLEPD